MLRIKDRFHGLFAYSLNQEGLMQQHLGRFLKMEALNVLGVDGTAQVDGQAAFTQENHRRTLRFMRNLHHVGLGGAKAQRVFAEVMSGILAEHVRSTYASRWSTPSTIPEQLRFWVENYFARFAVEVLASLKEENDTSSEQLTRVTHTDVERWQEMGINELGALRTNELFDIIVNWNSEENHGAIEDLKHYITKTSSRTHLTSSFSDALSQRLLQPGASTTEILQVYISVIDAFLLLDSKGVLLDRVARPIRRYLRERDDTVTIIVSGLLADPEDESCDAEVLVELAKEMNRSTNLAGEDEMDDGELDWDDMSWMPDPVDAGPGKIIGMTMDLLFANR